MQGISWLTENLLASQEGHLSMELDSYGVQWKHSWKYAIIKLDTNKNRVANIKYTKMLSICAIVRDKSFFFYGTYKALLWNEADQTVSVAESDRKFNK